MTSWDLGVQFLDVQFRVGKSCPCHPIFCLISGCKRREERQGGLWGVLGVK